MMTFSKPVPMVGESSTEMPSEMLVIKWLSGPIVKNIRLIHVPGGADVGSFKNSTSVAEIVAGTEVVKNDYRMCRCTIANRREDDEDQGVAKKRVETVPLKSPKPNRLLSEPWKAYTKSIVSPLNESRASVAPGAPTPTPAIASLALWKIEPKSMPDGGKPLNVGVISTECTITVSISA